MNLVQWLSRRGNLSFETSDRARRNYFPGPFINFLVKLSSICTFRPVNYQCIHHHGVTKSVVLTLSRQVVTWHSCSVVTSADPSGHSSEELPAMSIGFIFWSNIQPANMSSNAATRPVSFVSNETTNWGSIHVWYQNQRYWPGICTHTRICLWLF